MMTFFTILLVLIGANALFMVFSLSGINNGGKKSQANESTSPKVYPLNNLSSKLKKAV
ncbi:hypothetical protein [Zobellia barbeyronii]|uniref:Uncharacterized protein n=1 Tax=Zobellia barbeyronii TaxID=2748009 RepID=A0ABS5WFY5_9FLAO|nr:hypothetical protein [Zobellia barbeyronii]MBT2162149.1 hypothetical protein [Zobellia barbeyronii]